MRTNIKPLALLSLVLSSAACTSFEDENAGGDDVETGEDTDVSTSDTVSDTALPDATTDVEGSDAEGSDAVALTGCAAASAIEAEFAIPGCGYSIPMARYYTERLPDCEADVVDPAHTPRAIHLNYPQGDASTAVAMLWQTGFSNRWTQVEYGTSADALTSVQTGLSFTYATLGGTRVAEADKRLVHEAHLCGLTPATTYYYRVGGGEIWSDVYSFTTAPAADSDAEFTFAVTGDTRSTTQELWGQALDRAILDGAEFLAFTGDAVEAGTTQEQWDAWFGRGEPSEQTDRLATLPFMFANGNHDVGADPVWANFAQPGVERYATIRYGNAVFVVLNDDPFSMLANGESVEDEGADYLRAALEANEDATWRFVVNHRPFYSASTNHGSQDDIQQAWLPIVDEFEVDMVLNGHDHNYERSKFVRGGSVVADGQGTIYVVAAGIGAPMYGNGSDWWTAYSESVPSYAMITIDGSTLTYTAKRLDGTVIDELTWTKD
jgi:hypothetical protein